MSYICIHLGFPVISSVLHFLCRSKAFAGVSFHLPENFLCHFLKCQSADSNFKFPFVEKPFSPCIFERRCWVQNAGEVNMSPLQPFHSVTPLSPDLQFPRRSLLSFPSLCLHGWFFCLPPRFPLIFSSVHVVSRQFFCLLVYGLQPPGCSMCVYYRLLGSIAALLPGSTEGWRM